MESTDIEKAFADQVVKATAIWLCMLSSMYGWKVEVAKAELRDALVKTCTFHIFKIMLNGNVGRMRKSAAKLGKTFAHESTIAYVKLMAETCGFQASLCIAAARVHASNSPAAMSIIDEIDGEMAKLRPSIDYVGCAKLTAINTVIAAVNSAVSLLNETMSVHRSAIANTHMSVLADAEE